MRIVISNGSRVWGGAEAMAESLAVGLQRRGHEVVVFCRSGAPLEERVRGVLATEPVLGGFDAHPVTVARSMRALRRHRSQVVITNTDKEPRVSGLAARLLGIPVVFRQETDHAYKNTLRYRLFYGWVPAVHLVNSEATRRTMLSSVDWVPAERVAVIPNGIDPEPFLVAEPADLGLPEGAVAIGYVGRFEKRKGIYQLAAAWPRIADAIPEAHLLIVGWGPMEKEFPERLAGAPRVHWLGFRTDVPRIMKALDVLLVPSHYEGFGLVAVEAMAAGTAVVATRASSLPEIVTDGEHGRLVEPRDPEALARGAIELTRDPGLRARMGEAGRARVLRDFTHERMLERHEALLESLIRSHADRK
jgi:glycosyltransferase involved in cell wall biosynthesis